MPDDAHMAATLEAEVNRVQSWRESYRRAKGIMDAPTAGWADTRPPVLRNPSGQKHAYRQVVSEYRPRAGEG